MPWVATRVERRELSPGWSTVVRQQLATAEFMRTRFEFTVGWERLLFGVFGLELAQQQLTVWKRRWQFEVEQE